MAIQVPRPGRRKITCEFFEVTTLDPSLAPYCLADLLTKIMNEKPLPEQRNLSMDNDIYRLVNFGYIVGSNGPSQKDCFGTLLRLKTDKAVTTGKVNDDEIKVHDLEPGVFVAEHFAFRYLHRFKTIVIHRNRSAGRGAKLSEYIAKMSGVEDLAFSLIFSGNSLARAKSFNFISSYELLVAVPDMLSAFDPGGTESVKGVLGIGQDFRGATIEIKVKRSRGKAKPTLRKSAVTENIENLLDFYSTYIKKAKVKGRRYQDTPDEVIDLIEDRMFEEVEIEFADRLPTPEELQEGLQRAYKLRWKDLCRQYGVPGDS